LKLLQEIISQIAKAPQITNNKSTLAYTKFFASSSLGSGSRRWYQTTSINHQQLYKAGKHWGFSKLFLLIFTIQN